MTQEENIQRMLDQYIAGEADRINKINHLTESIPIIQRLRIFGKTFYAPSELFTEILTLMSFN
jgi:hypothetical protein